MSPYTKRLIIQIVFALINSVLAYILLDYFILEMKIWQYIVIESVVALMHVLHSVVKQKAEETFPDEENENF